MKNPKTEINNSIYNNIKGIQYLEINLTKLVQNYTLKTTKKILEEIKIDLND